MNNLLKKTPCPHCTGITKNLQPCKNHTCDQTLTCSMHKDQKKQMQLRITKMGEEIKKLQNSPTVKNKSPEITKLRRLTELQQNLLRLILKQEETPRLEEKMKAAEKMKAEEKINLEKFQQQVLQLQEQMNKLYVEYIQLPKHEESEILQQEIKEQMQDVQEKMGQVLQMKQEISQQQSDANIRPIPAPDSVIGPHSDVDQICRRINF